MKQFLKILNLFMNGIQSILSESLFLVPVDKNDTSRQWRNAFMEDITMMCLVCGITIVGIPFLLKIYNFFV